MTRKLLRGAVLPVLLAACSDAPVDDAPAAAGTSPGILTEELRIDGHAADLVPVGGLRVGRDGTVIVAQPQDHAVRYFSPDGVATGSFGARGRGPGEFTSILTIGGRADSLWVFDMEQRRVTLVGPDRTLVRTVPLVSRPNMTSGDTRIGPRYALLPVPAALLPDGSMLASVFTAGAVPEEFRDHNVIVRVGSDGEWQGIVARVPHGDRSVEIPGGQVALPFPNYGLLAVADDGSRVAGAFTSTAGADADNLTVTVWDTAGTPLFTRSVRFAPESIPASVADSAHAALAARLPGDIATLYSRGARTPAAYPPLIDLVLGRDLSIWIVTRAAGGRHRVDALDSSGDRVGTFVLPLNSGIAAAELGRIWLLEKDELDVESVVRYAVRWQ